MTVTTDFPDLDAAFAEFDAANPHVWQHFERFTLLAIAAGREHYSAEAIVQRIRWHLNIETKSEDGFRLNDHHRKRYALKFHAAHPEFDGFFRKREAATHVPSM